MADDFHYVCRKQKANLRVVTWLVRYSAASTTKLSKNCLWAASWSRISFSLQKQRKDENRSATLFAQEMGPHTERQQTSGSCTNFGAPPWGRQSPLLKIFTPLAGIAIFSAEMTPTGIPTGHLPLDDGFHQVLRVGFANIFT